MSQAASATRTVLATIFVNTALALTKLISGYLGSTYALIADGIESLLDIFTSVAVWGGLKYAERPPDHNHPFGHGRAESLAALVVALVVIAAGLGIAFQSIHEILTPHSVPRPFTLFVLLGVVLTKELLYRRVARIGQEANSTALTNEAWHQRSDALTSAAAFLGILIAVTGGKEYASADDWAALFASGIICLNGGVLLRTALAEVMDESPSDELLAAVRGAAEEVAGVVRIEKCRVRKLGFSYHVDIHVEVDGELPVWRGHEIAHKVKDALLHEARLSVSDAVVHIEPDSGLQPRAAQDKRGDAEVDHPSCDINQPHNRGC